MILDMWSLLLVTLPTQPNAVRLRIWRALKALGCAALRDGAYLLPQAQAGALDTLADEVRRHGGTASVLALGARDAGQQTEWQALFDRGEAYAVWRGTAQALQIELPALAQAGAETEARRRQRGVADALAALRAIDYFAGPAAAQAESDLTALRSAVDGHFSRGEPQARPAQGIALLARADFQRQTWATRARPRVDRLACAWLIRRFIDPQAQFAWLPAGDAESATPPVPPPGAVGFDFDGARFSHIGALVTFEVLMASFALADDARLRRIAGAVHYLDAGGIPVPEAAGLESVLAGLRALHADDDGLAAAATTVFDALYAAPGAPT